MPDDVTAKDPDVERIAAGLLRYLKETCMSDHTAKFAICEALYEMQAIARGQQPQPAVVVDGVPVHHS